MNKIILLCIAIILVSGCVVPSFFVGNTGLLQIKITDVAILGNITSVKITISDLQVYKAGENETEGQWITVISGPKTIELLEVKDVKDILGEKELEPGKYTQVRLKVTSATITINSKEYTLTIPSTEIKLNHPFTIEANKTTSLVLDFDATSSVVSAAGKYLLKPVVNIMTEFEGKDIAEAERIKTEQTRQVKTRRKK